MAKIIVTGSNGFIGKNLINSLSKSGHNIINTSRSHGDIALKVTWDLFQPADVLIHLAAKTFVPDSWADPMAFIENNFNGTLNALEYCRQHKAKFIYLSSYLYGNTSTMPIAESSPLVASNPYALSKKLSEDLCSFYSKNYNVDCIILRPFNVYGPGQSSQFLIPAVLNQIKKSSCVIVKDLEPKRDYIYVDDLVNAIILSVDIKLPYGVFNIGTGLSYSVGELIEVIKKIKGLNVLVESTGERRSGEIMDSRADISNAINILHWSPMYSLENGLKKMLINFQ